MYHINISFSTVQKQKHSAQTIIRTAAVLSKCLVTWAFRG